MNCSQELTVFFRSTGNPVLYLFVEQGPGTGEPITGLCEDDIQHAAYLAPDQQKPVPLGLAGGSDRVAPDGRICRFREVDARLMPGLYTVELSRALLSPGYNYLYLDFSGAADVYLPLSCVDYDSSEPYAMALINWAQSSCHDHLTSGLRRWMPSIMQPLLD